MDAFLIILVGTHQESWARPQMFHLEKLSGMYRAEDSAGRSSGSVPELEERRLRCIALCPFWVTQKPFWASFQVIESDGIKFIRGKCDIAAVLVTTPSALNRLRKLCIYIYIVERYIRSRVEAASKMRGARLVCAHVPPILRIPRAKPLASL